jgi:CDP-paratose 2-epimerase
MKVVVTGGAGLVGSECCKLFSTKGWDVVSVDNYLRGELLGAKASTKSNVEVLRKYVIEHHEIDIRDEQMVGILEGADAVIHTAAQPSHPKSIEIPLQDFQINAWGTLQLLQRVREANKEAVFIYCSSNKVYGDVPNYFSYVQVDKRLEPADPSLWNGFDESLRVDRCLHTPFGVSKTAADLYTQEYARLYGLKTGTFRMGCITGASAKAAEMHNWEPYFVMKALNHDPVTIYGHGGYQVRDVIAASDLARLFYEFVIDPHPGEVYNVGGGRQNSISLLESFDLIEQVTGQPIKSEHGPAREGDHIWWITNNSKAMSHFPKWQIIKGLTEIFTEIYRGIQELQVA